MSEQRDWPPEQSAKGTLRPWHYTAVGYLAVLFEDPEEANGPSAASSSGACPRVTFGSTTARRRCRSRPACSKNAPPWPRQSRKSWSTTGQKNAGWATPGQAVPSSLSYAPSKEHANRMVGLLSDYQYGSLDYFGEHGVEVIEQDVGSTSTGQGNDRRDPDDHSYQHPGF